MDPNYKDFYPNYIMNEVLIEGFAKAGFKKINLNGISGDFNPRNEFYSLFSFKKGFNSNVVEYIGEFDLIVNKPFHQLLWTTNKIQKEFYKPAIKNS